MLDSPPVTTPPQLMRTTPLDNANVSYKFIIIGCAGVGKTALLKRLVDDNFSDSTDPTVGVEFEAVVLQIDNQKVRLQIWDTAGQEKFRAITKAYYRTAAGVLIVFDLTDRRSFDQLPSWINDVRTLCDPFAVSTLVGNRLHKLTTRFLIFVKDLGQLTRHGKQ
jgi:small GTP-binding protein